MYLKKQTFLVFGLSRSGRAGAEYLLKRGATVYLYDEGNAPRMLETAESLVAQGAKAVAKEDLQKTAELCEALLLSPGIPVDHPLAVAFKRSGKGVLGEAELAVQNMRCPIVAVSGTNGKTTTVSMLTETLKRGGLTAKSCGNIGLPMVDFCDMREEEIAVAEISSFQLETLHSLRPHIAVLLNITEDHLNRHYTMENYVFLKAKLLKNLTETEFAVLNYDDLTVRNLAEKTKAQVLYFSVKERVKGAYFEGDSLYFGKEKIISAEALPIEGVHNIQNALAVIACAKIMGVSTEAIAQGLTEFKGIKHRIEYIAEVDGVKYIDDSKGTNIGATVKAVETMKTPTLLLLGGKNKGYDYRALFSALKNSQVVHAVLYGENRYALFKAARESGFDGFTFCESFEVAVKIAAMQAKRGQTVLLSPASASFDEFASYEERGDKFVEMVRALESERATSKSAERTLYDGNEQPTEEIE